MTHTEDGTPVSPGDFRVQTRFIFQLIQKVLQAAVATLDDVVRAGFYITDVSKHGEVSAVRNEYFAVARPASLMVEIRYTVAKGCDVEIEVTAIMDNVSGGLHE